MAETEALTQQHLAGLAALARLMGISATGTTYVLNVGDAELIIDTQAMTISTE